MAMMVAVHTAALDVVEARSGTATRGAVDKLLGARAMSLLGSVEVQHLYSDVYRALVALRTSNLGPRALPGVEVDAFEVAVVRLQEQITREMSPPSQK